MRRLSVLTLAITIAASAVLVSCSSSDDDAGSTPEVTSEERPYVDAVTKSFDEKDEDDESMADTLKLPNDKKECIASRIVDVLRVDRLKKAGITPAKLDMDDLSALKLSTDEGGDAYDSFEKCGINVRDLMITEMRKDEDTTKPMMACLENALTEENLRAMFSVTIAKGEEAAKKDPKVAGGMGAMLGCAFMGMSDATTSTTGG